MSVVWTVLENKETFPKLFSASQFNTTVFPKVGFSRFKLFRQQLWRSPRKGNALRSYECLKIQRKEELPPKSQVCFNLSQGATGKIPASSDILQVLPLICCEGSFLFFFFALTFLYLYLSQKNSKTRIFILFSSTFQTSGSRYHKI